MYTTAKAYPEKKQITLFLSGDVMTGRGIDQAFPFSVDPVLHESYVNSAAYYVTLAEHASGAIPQPISYDYVWGEGLEDLKQADVRIINLETSVTTSSDYASQKSIHYRMHPQNIAFLSEADITVCVLANNHVLDWGEAGLCETLQTIQNQKILTAGAGADDRTAARPVVIETAAGRLLIFAYAVTDSGVPPSWAASPQSPGINLLQRLDNRHLKKVIGEIKNHRLAGDRVVVSFHWGGNWGYEVPGAHQDFAHRLIESGAADLIHGHSSHHPKPIEIYKNHLILYGCGDLINDYEGIGGYECYRDDLSFMYFPVLDKSGEIRALKLVPMNVHRFRLNRVREADRRWLLERMNRECKRFGTSIRTTGEDYFELCW